jgi:hypothetical protein
MLRRAGLLTALALAATIVAPAARADLGDERALAERYAPVVRLVEQSEPCGYGEPYTPIDVDVVFDEPTVALRGAWGAGDIVRIAPAAADLSKGLYEYHLDFPGRALEPGCDYERWNDRLSAGSQPTVYAHVVADPAFPGRLALQYWFFYTFNDFNNKHEGDWEMIQLVFEAGDAAEALQADPTEVGYSQHEGAERAAWGDDKVELVDGTHPVVHPAAGSHANYFEEALYLGRTAEQGIGCDDTSGPTVELRPAVRPIPSDADAATGDFPWIAYEGRWGELQKAFYNGPTGPNLKKQWNQPLAWVEEDWRDSSYAIPAGGLLGTGATDFFCDAVRSGSDALRRIVDDPAPALLFVGLLAAFGLFGATRTTWRPSTPLRVGRRRAWGQTLTASASMYRRRWTLLVGIALVFLPISVVITAVEAAAFSAVGVSGAGGEGETGGLLALLALLAGTVLTLGGLGLVQAATARALVEVDEGREITALGAYRLALGRLPSLLGALGLAVAAAVALGLTVVLLPVAVWLVGRWALVAQVVELEDRSPLTALRRSSDLVSGRWLKVASLAVVGAGFVLALGPLVGALLIFVTDVPFALLNVFAGLAYALAMPLVALTTSYLYFDAIVRERLERSTAVDELPSEM